MRLLKKLILLCLLGFVISCSSNKTSSNIDVSITNDIKITGTFYIVETSYIEEPLYDLIQEDIDKNLEAYGFIKLRDKTSQQTANYLVFLDLKEEGHQFKKFTIQILDNTSSNLKNVFVGEFTFKRVNSYGNRLFFSCGIQEIFANNNLIENTKSFSDIKTIKKSIDCLGYQD
jgi:hypothetical protein